MVGGRQADEMREPVIDRRWAGAVILGQLVLLLGLWLSGGNREVFLWVNQLAPQWPVFWSWVTLLGDTLVLFSLLLLFVGRRPEVVWSVVIAALLVSLAVHGIKPFLDWPRPPAVFAAGQLQTIGYVASSGSFPSGHTAAAFTLAGVLCMLSSARWLKWSVLLLAALVGVSRMAVGIHWPVDVVGGALLGWLAAASGIWLAARSRWGMGRHAQRLIALILLGITVLLFFSGDLGYPLGRPLLIMLPLLVLPASLPGLRRIIAG
jgi:membrane-associated phospholipid phosphatase